MIFSQAGPNTRPEARGNSIVCALGLKARLVHHQRVGYHANPERTTAHDDQQDRVHDLGVNARAEVRRELEDRLSAANIPHVTLWLSKLA